MMEGLNIIEGQTLKNWENRFTNIEQYLLTLTKICQQLLPVNARSSVPDFITVEKAAEKYNVSKTSIYNKLKLFAKKKGREIDRLQLGTFNLINEVELLEALRIKTPIPEIFKLKKKAK